MVKVECTEIQCQRKWHIREGSNVRKFLTKWFEMSMLQNFQYIPWDLKKLSPFVLYIEVESSHSQYNWTFMCVVKLQVCKLKHSHESGSSPPIAYFTSHGTKTFLPEHDKRIMGRFYAPWGPAVKYIYTLPEYVFLTVYRLLTQDEYKSVNTIRNSRCILSPIDTKV